MDSKMGSGTKDRPGGLHSRATSAAGSEYDVHEEPQQLTDENFNGTKPRRGGETVEGSEKVHTSGAKLRERESYEPRPRSNTHSSMRSNASRLLRPVESEDIEVPEEQGDPLIKRLWNWARPNYLLDHFDKDSIKTVIPTWIQVWVSGVIMIIPTSGQYMSIVGFLLPLFAIIEASGGLSVSLNFYLSIAVVLFALVGWVHCLVAQAIAWQIRGRPTEAQIVEQVIAQGLCDAENIKTCLTRLIFEGHFLETRTTVIFIFALLFGYTTLGFMRVNIVLTTGFIIGSIVLTILCCYMSHFPYFDIHTIAVPVLKAVGFTFCVRMACALVFWPTSSSCRYVGGMTKFLGLVNNMVASTRSSMATRRPSAGLEGIGADIPPMAATIQGGIARMEVIMKVLGWEISFGRFDQGDVGELRALTRGLVSWMASYEYFYAGIQERIDVIRQELAPVATRRSTYSSATVQSSKLYAALHSTYKPIGAFEDQMRKSFLDLARNDFDPDGELKIEDLDRLMDLIHKRYDPLLQAMGETITCTIQWLTTANKFRLFAVLKWSKHKKRQQEQNERLKASLQALHKALDDASDDSWKKLVKDEGRTGKLMLSLVGKGSLFGFITRQAVGIITNLANLCLSIDDHRPVPVIITPFTRSLRALPSINMRLGQVDEEENQEFAGFVPYSNVEVRNPDSSPARSVWHLVGIQFTKAFKLLYHKDLIFNVKRAVFGVAIASPFFIRSSAWEMYSKRLIWIPIMAVMTINPTVVDTFYSIVSRATATFFGCLIGMTAWYIASGSGTGNYYGFSATTLVLFFFMAFYRHFSAHMTPQPVIVFCVTVILNLGLSWTDEHVPSLGSIGYGWDVAWLRFVTVLAGLLVGFLATVFPKPRTGKKIVRQILGKSLQELGNISADISKFGLQRMDDPTIHMTMRKDAVTHRLRAVIMAIATASRIIESLKYEPSLTGRWPMEKYKVLASHLRGLFTLHGMLYQVLNQLEEPEKWIPIVYDMLGWINYELCADFYAVISLGSRSLLLPAPLPRVTPAQTTVKHMSHLMGYPHYSSSAVADSSSVSPSNSSHQDEDGQTSEQGSKNSSIDEILGHDGQLSTVALVLVHTIYEMVDKSMVLIKSLVGEEFDVDLKLYDMTMDNDEEPDVEMIKLLA